MPNSEGRPGPVPKIRLPFNYDAGVAVNEKGHKAVFLVFETVVGDFQHPMTGNTAIDLGNLLIKRGREANRVDPKSKLLLPDSALAVPGGDRDQS